MPWAGRAQSAETAGSSCSAVQVQNTMGRTQFPVSRARPRRTWLQCAQKGCSTACLSPIAAPGSSKKALVPPYCSTQSGKMSGLAVSSGTRAGGSSSRGTPPSCHSAASILSWVTKEDGAAPLLPGTSVPLTEACAGRVLLPPWPCTAQELKDEQKEPWTPEMGSCMAMEPRRMDKNQN